jgi:hypothetical protein
MIYWNGKVVVATLEIIQEKESMMLKNFTRTIQIVIMGDQLAQEIELDSKNLMTLRRKRNNFIDENTVKCIAPFTD